MSLSQPSKKQQPKDQVNSQKMLKRNSEETWRKEQPKSGLRGRMHVLLWIATGTQINMQKLSGLAIQKCPWVEKAQASPRLHVHVVKTRAKLSLHIHHYQVWRTLQEAATQKTCTQAREGQGSPEGHTVLSTETRFFYPQQSWDTSSTDLQQAAP